MTRAYPGTVVEPSRRAPERVGRLRTAVRSTPAHLVLWLAALLTALLAYAAVALFTNVRTDAAVASIRTSSGPLAVAAQSLYRSLSDADATAAGAFLSGGPEPADLRQRYDDDIAAAGAGLVEASTGNSAGSTAVTTLATELPVYTGLVETARADNRLGYPVGAAYLREATNLMRTVLLPAADSLYTVETDRLAADRRGAAEYPFVAVGLGLVALAVLVRAQRYLTHRTRRLVNPGAAAATLAVVAALVWQNLAWLNLSRQVNTAAHTGIAQVELLAQARIAALQARADEALTLVARGSGSAFEDDYQTIMRRLAGSGGGGLLATASARASDPAVRAAVDTARDDLADWRGVHTTLHNADEDGQYPTAVSLAIDPSDAHSAATTFTHLDADLATGIRLADADFRAATDRAAGARSGVAVAVSVLVLIAVGAVAMGIRRRIAEYR